MSRLCKLCKANEATEGDYCRRCDDHLDALYWAGEDDLIRKLEGEG